MRRFRKKIEAVLAAGLAVVMLAGCQGGAEAPGNGESSKEDGQAMGRYLEEDAVMPEGMTSALDMVKMEDRIRILGMNERGGYTLWDSRDGGDSWETAGKLAEDKFGGNGIWLGMGALSPLGDGFLCEYEEDGSMSYYHMTEQFETQEVKLELGEIDLSRMDAGEDEAGEEAEGDGGESPVEESTQPEETESPVEDPSEESTSGDTEGMLYGMDMANSLMDVKYSSDGILYGTDMNNVLYRIDPENGETQEIASEIQAFEMAGNVVIAEDISSETVMYDAATGEAAGQDQVLADVIKKAGGMISFVSGVKQILFQTGEDNSVYYCSSQGLYRHIFGGTVNEQLIDGNLNSLSSPDAGLAAMCAADDGAFLILISQSDGESKLLKYTYSRDTPSRPDRELRLYALNDSEQIRQAISMFQKEHTDYYINFEVGLADDSGVTVSDALKTLNAEIMAGKGPDILVLDGMPVQSYMEKGLLEDLTDIFMALKEGDGCFEQIAKTYQTEKGICAIPCRFTVPVIDGPGELVGSAGDLKAFADEIERLRGEDDEISGVIESSSPDLLTEKLYSSYSPAMLKEDGSLDEERAEEFYTQLKRIYDTGRYSAEEVETVSYSVHAGGVSMWTDLSMGTVGLLGGAMKANVGLLGNVYGFNQMMAVSEKEGLEYDLLTLAGKKVYCPETILGISSRSGQTEDARRFVEYVLKKDVQAFSQGGGFPVNKKAYEEATVDKSNGENIEGLLSTNAETGESVSLSIPWAGQEDFDSLYQKLEELDTPCLTDRAIDEAVKEQAVKCLTGECTVKEAVGNLVRKVNLYLAE